MGESVAKAIDTLPSDMRAMVVMRFWEELSYEEIARRMNLPLSTVWRSLYEAGQRLFGKLEPYVGASSPEKALDAAEGEEN